MNKPLRSLFLLAVLGLFASSVWCADKSPGGKGKLESSWALNESFKPVEPGTIVEVGAKYTINWKLWTLMGA
jgi:hypothetical protein